MVYLEFPLESLRKERCGQRHPICRQLVYAFSLIWEAADGVDIERNVGGHRNGLFSFVGTAESGNIWKKREFWVVDVDFAGAIVVDSPFDWSIAQFLQNSMSWLVRPTVEYTEVLASRPTSCVIH